MRETSLLETCTELISLLSEHCPVTPTSKKDSYSQRIFAPGVRQGPSKFAFIPLFPVVCKEQDKWTFGQPVQLHFQSASEEFRSSHALT